MLLRVTPKYGGAVQEIIIPNNTEAGRRADPQAALMNPLKGCQAGDFLKVTTVKKQGRDVLSAVGKYSLKPGEDDPEAYEFVRVTGPKVGGENSQAVVLRKLEKEQTVLVPNTKDAQGQAVPDERIAAQVRKLKEGDFVDVEVTRSGGEAYLRSIYPYQAAVSASFVKMGSEKVAGGSALSTVELKQGEQTVVVCLPASSPGGPADPVMMSKVRQLRAGQAVLYKAIEEDGKKWLTSIRPAPVAAAEGGAAALTGTYVYNGEPKKTQNLKAVLTSVGPGDWKAVYTITQSGKPMNFTGTVKGSLRNGPVSGTGATADGKRTFEFSGTATNGTISFNHFETTGGKRVATGTGSLRLAA
jgi:hypothetical protein